jgi:hypothetical protein
MDRQALHASGLNFHHPKFGRPVTVDLDLPDDMQLKIYRFEKLFIIYCRY